MKHYPSAPKGSSLDVLFTTLAKAGVEYAGAHSRGGAFYCPLHPDSNPSFDVNVGSKGFAVFRCAPCAAQYSQDWYWKCLRELGIGWKGAPVFDAASIDWGETMERVEKRTGKKAKVPMEAKKRSVYKFADGTPNFRILRLEETDASYASRGGVGKRRKATPPYTFNPRTREWIKGLSDSVERTPYGLEFFDGWKGLPIWIVEGEKCAEALWDAGVPATCFAGGAQAPVPSSVWRFFTNFSVVLFGADRDPAGLGFMHRLESDLKASGLRSGGLFVTPERFGLGGDAADFLADDPKARWLRKHLDPVTPDLERAVERAHAAEKASAAASAPQTPTPARKGQEGRSVAPRAGVGSRKPLTAAESPQVSPPVVEDDPVTDSLKPYGSCLRRDPGAVASEFLDRFYGGETGSWRYFGGDRWGVWDEALGHFRRYDTELIEHRIHAELRGSLETSPDGEVGPMVLLPNSLRDLRHMLRTVSQVTEHGPGSLRSLRGAVPFRNGVLDVKTRELVEAGPTWDLWWSLPFDWTGEKESVKNWLAYLESIGFKKGGEEQRFLQQLFGYVLAGRDDIQKIVLLQGPPRSGKGTILSVLHALLGDGAKGMTLQALTENFGLQEIIGKGLLTFGDVRFRGMDADVTSKLLSISSTDELPVDIKYGKPKSVVFGLGGRIVMASNDVPTFTGEASSAIADRFVVLRFTESYLGREDPTWLPRILGELPGIVRWALAGLDEMGDQHFFNEPAAGDLIRKQIKDSSAPIRLFVEECCELGDGLKVKNDELFLRYTRWCELNNLKALNSIHFSRDLLTAFTGQIENGLSQSARVKKGVRLRS